LTFFNIEVKRTWLISKSFKDQSEANPAYSKTYKDRSEATSAYSRYKEGRSEVNSAYFRNRNKKNDLDQSKTYGGGIFITLWSPGIDSKELIPPAHALAGRSTYL
jgi:hypothetical protein